MFKRLLCALVALMAATAFAAGVDVNKANQAELETLKGIGPAMAGKILDERKKGAFKDWADLTDRVKGIGPANAAKFSAEGLTVAGDAFKAAPAAAKPDKATAKAPAPNAKKADKADGPTKP
jgi:competence protein ComEA